MTYGFIQRILLFIFILPGLTTQAQIHEPVLWDTEVVEISEDEYELIFNASIEDKWHLYSQELPL